MCAADHTVAVWETASSPTASSGNGKRRLPLRRRPGGPFWKGKVRCFGIEDDVCDAIVCSHSTLARHSRGWARIEIAHLWSDGSATSQRPHRSPPSANAVLPRYAALCRRANRTTTDRWRGANSRQAQGLRPLPTNRRFPEPYRCEQDFGGKQNRIPQIAALEPEDQRHSRTGQTVARQQRVWPTTRDRHRPASRPSRKPVFRSAARGGGLFAHNAPLIARGVHRPSTCMPTSGQYSGKNRWLEIEQGKFSSPHLLGPRHCHLLEQRQIALGINLCRVQVGMPQQIRDGLESDSSLHQM